LVPRRRREVRAAYRAARFAPDRIRVASPEARQPPALRLRVVHRQVASFRQLAAQRVAAPDALAEEHPAVSSSARLRREVCRDGSSVPRQREASSRALRPEERMLKARLSKVPRPAELLSWAALPWVPRPAFPARAWCPKEAARCAAARLAVLSWGCLRREAAWWLLRPAEVSAWCARAVPRSREAAAVGRDAGAAQPSAVPAEPVASAQLPVVAWEEVSAAAAVPQRAAAGAWVAGEAPLQAVAVAPVAEEEEPQRAAEAAVSGAAAGPQPVAASVLSASQPAAVHPSVAPWAFRRARVLPWPVRRQAARSARAMRRSQAASPSERSWQAARCEGLS
jgi:hypothetical protein